MKFYKSYNVADLIADKYEVWKIKTGGMGIVYICADRSEKQILALKTFQSKLSFSNEQVERFKHEALLWVSLPWHQNIVKALGVIVDQSLPFIVLEYVHGNNDIGNNLRDYIRSNILSIKDKLELSIQICNAMAFILDRSNFIHRDLKPENILITEDKTAKITDFGISKIQEVKRISNEKTADASFLQSGIKGTKIYMSPEQILGEPLDSRSDIFSMGIVLFELFSGAHPFISHDNNYSIVEDKILYSAPYKLNNQNNEVPDEVIYLIHKCLEKDPSNRILSFKEITENLKRSYFKIFGKHIDIDSLNTKHDLKTEFHKKFSRVSGLIEFGRIEEAELLLLEITNEDPEFWQGWSSIALIYQGKREFEKGREAYLNAIKINPEEPILWNSYGVLLIEMGNLVESRKALEMALKLNPHYFKAYTNLASIYDEEKNYPEAIRYCEEAIKINPRSDKAWYNRGYYCTFICDYVKSIESADKAIELNPNYLKAYFIKAISCYYLFREDEARDAIKTAKLLAPNDSQIQFWYDKLNG